MPATLRPLSLSQAPASLRSTLSACRGRPALPKSWATTYTVARPPPARFQRSIHLSTVRPHIPTTPWQPIRRITTSLRQSIPATKRVHLPLPPRPLFPRQKWRTGDGLAPLRTTQAQVYVVRFSPPLHHPSGSLGRHWPNSRSLPDELPGPSFPELAPSTMWA